MPHLRGDDANQAEFDAAAFGQARPHVEDGAAPVRDGLRIEVAGAAQRLFAQEMLDERWRLAQEEAVARGAEHALRAPGHLVRQPALAQLAQDVLVAEAAQLPARAQAGKKREDVL